MSVLDEPTVALVRLAAAIATGNGPLVESRCRAVQTCATPPIWVDELMLQSILMVGYPRALQAAAQWSQLRGGPAVWDEDGSAMTTAAWATRGEATCRTVYGANYDKLRENVRAMHPAIDAWMVVEGYGRTLGRPGLDLARRELCVVAQVTTLEAERQLHSHLRGASNAGATPEMIAELFRAIAPEAGQTAVAKATALWDKIRR